MVTKIIACSDIHVPSLKGIDEFLDAARIIKHKYQQTNFYIAGFIEEGEVFITPGFIFGTNGSRYVRISLCAKPEKMHEALHRICEMNGKC